jgi:hypothetical protein
MERTGRDQCQASSTASDSNEVHISVSSRSEIYHQQGDGGENQEEECHRSEIQLGALNYANEQSNISKLCSGSTTSPQEPAHVHRSSQQPAAAFIVPNTAGKGQVTDEYERDTEQQCARNSRRSNLANPTALVETARSEPGLSHNLTAVDACPSQDINEEIYDYLASGIRDNSLCLTPLKRVESFLAPFLNNQITPGPKDKNSFPQSEDDVKLVQILRYIQSCDGALDLLWNFMQEHTELLAQQQANISCDTVQPTYDDKQYWLGEDLKGGETREVLCSVMGPTQYTRTSFTGSNAKTEEMSVAYCDAKDSNMEKDDKIQIVDTSSDTLKGRPPTPQTDFSSEGQIIIITGDVREATVLHVGTEENVGDSSLEKVVASEAHWVRHEEEQEQQTGKQECPVWQILKKFECPFQWVPDVAINSIPSSTARENMITYLTGKPTNIIQVYSILCF